MPSTWRDPAFYDAQALEKEMERVFDICHGCRRCVSLCQAFPTLFDLVDASPTLEVDGVAKHDYAKVVDQCYLCDVCYMTKCPYVPPHPWNVDFPHLMLRAKAVDFRNGRTKLRDRILTSTDRVGRLATIPVVVQMVNKANAHAGGAQGDGQGARRRRRSRAAAVRERARFATPPRHSIAWPVRNGRAHARQGRDLLDLLHQLQRAGHRPRPPRACSRTTRFRIASWKRRPAAGCPSSSSAISSRSRG